MKVELKEYENKMKPGIGRFTKTGKIITAALYFSFWLNLPW